MRYVNLFVWSKCYTAKAPYICTAIYGHDFSSRLIFTVWIKHICMCISNPRWMQMNSPLPLVTNTMASLNGTRCECAVCIGVRVFHCMGSHAHIRTHKVRVYVSLPIELILFLPYKQRKTKAEHVLEYWVNQWINVLFIFLSFANLFSD